MRNGKWANDYRKGDIDIEMGNGRSEMGSGTSIEHRPNIQQSSIKQLIEHPLEIYRRYIENGNAAKIHEISIENALTSTDNWKANENQARIHVTIHRRDIEDGRCIEHP